MDPGVMRLVGLAGAISTVAGLALWGGVRLLFRRRRPLSRGDRAVAFTAFGGMAAGLACFGWAFVEPDLVSQTQVEVRTARLPAGQRLRIVHLTDLHLDRARPLHAEVLARVNALKPDLLVFTGDSLNTAEGLQPFRQLIAGVAAPLGRFAVRGNHDVWYWGEQDLFGGGVATELGGQPVDLPGTNVTICGTPYGAETPLVDCVARADPKRFVIAAYHTPDLVERMAPDLYLAGHTHGGQVRMPFYGAIVTLSAFDKKYEMGRYAVGATTLFVSRGVGVEPHAPRIRFLCRPEIAVIDVVGQ